MKSEFLTPHGKAILAIQKYEGNPTRTIIVNSSLSANTFYDAKKDLLEDGLIIEKEEMVGKIRVKKLFLTEKGKKVAEILKTLVLPS